MAVRTQPYRLDLGRIGSLDDLQVRLPEIVTNADQMFQELYEDLASAQDTADSNTVSSAALTKVDDTNVTLTLGGTPTTALLQAVSLTLGWTGTLSVARGGSGRGTATAYAVLCGGTTATGAHQSIASVGTAGQVLTSNGAAALPTFQAATTVTPAALTKTNDTNVTLTLGGTPATALLQATSLTLGWTGTLAVTRGGTGLATVAQGDLLYGSAADTLSRLAKDTNATRYLSNTGTTNNPAWAQVDLSNGVTGVLPTANGGTGVSANVAVLTARIALTEAQLEAFDTTSGTSITLVAAQGADKVIIPLNWSCEVNVTTGYGNNPSFRARWGTDTTLLPLGDLQTPGFNLGASGVRYTTNIAAQVLAFSRATFDPRNKALVANLTLVLTSPGTGVATAVVTVTYYVAQFT